MKRLSFALLLLLAACGKEESSSSSSASPSPPAEENKPSPEGEKKPAASTAKPFARIGCTGSQLASKGLLDGSTLCAQAVFLASKLETDGQRLVDTGTLTQNGQNFEYSKIPGDRLKIVFSNGTTTEIKVLACRGDFSSDWNNYLEKAHDLKVRVTTAGAVDLELTTYKESGRLREAISGTLLLENVKYTIDITLEGEYQAEVAPAWTDSTGQSHPGFTTARERRVCRGTVKAEGFEVEVNEEHDYRLSYATDSQKLVQNYIVTANNTWTADGSTYKLVDAEIRRSFINQKPGELDSYWKATGRVLRDGEPYGRIAGSTRGEAVRIWLEVGDEKIELEVWPKK